MGNFGRNNTDELSAESIRLRAVWLGQRLEQGGPFDAQ